MSSYRSLPQMQRLLVVALILCGLAAIATNASTINILRGKPQQQQQPIGSTSGNQTRPGTFERILIVNFENQPLQLTLLHEYFNYVAYKVGSLLGQYYAITHPSQPNYLCQIAGDYFGHNSDSNVNVNATTLVDLLEAKGLTWKSYQEDYPKANSGTGSCYVDANYQKLYYRKHNPFMTFDNIRNNPNRCRNIVSAEQLDIDIASGKLPNVMYYTPNIDNDGHNTGLNYANDWFAKWLPSKLNNPNFMRGTLIFVTFDEDDYLFENHIYAVVIGDMVKTGIEDRNTYNHYSLLRTIEENFQLGTLGRNDATANSFTSCFKNQ